jgi:biopolymer transport protein ExbD
MASHLRSDINVTPLVDIVLVLLIVFITLVPVLPHALVAVLPRPNPGGGGPALFLDLLEDGGLSSGGHAVTLTGLPSLVRASTGPVVLRVAPDLPFGRATEVMDLVKGVRPEARLALVPRPEAASRMLP